MAYPRKIAHHRTIHRFGGDSVPCVLLVYPNIWSEVFPLSILTLSAVLKLDDFEVDVFSAEHQRRANNPQGNVALEGVDPDAFRAFRQRIEDFQSQVIGFSVVEHAFPLALRLLDHITNPGIRGILGGVFPAFAAEIAARHARVSTAGYR